MSSIASETVTATQLDRGFQWLKSGSPNPDRAARIWVAGRLLSKGIAAHRIHVLRQDSKSDRARPYDHPALQDLTPDEEQLVPLREFEFDGSRLNRNGHAFMMVGTQSSPNSTYWLLASLHSKSLRDHVRVRLDPLLYGPTNNFVAPHYRMLRLGAIFELAPHRAPIRDGSWSMVAGQPRARIPFHRLRLGAERFGGRLRVRRSA